MSASSSPTNSSISKPSAPVAPELLEVEIIEIAQGFVDRGAAACRRTSTGSTSVAKSSKSVSVSSIGDDGGQFALGPFASASAASAAASAFGSG